MLLWRISRKRHTVSPDGRPADLLSGAGARAVGGRWNYPGTALVYTSGSVSLAAMEVFVHMAVGIVPRDHVLIEIDVPEEVFARAEELTPLPADWNAMPESDGAKRAGTDWAKSGRTAILEVPSVVIPRDRNYLINPLHADVASIRAKVREDFRFDPRMFR